jgi:leucyl aminopeptidase
MTTTQKIQWIDEIEADENGDDFVMSSTSIDDRFDITPNYYDSDAEKPVDFSLRDSTNKKNITTQSSVAKCKKAAQQLVDHPPVVYTTQELIERAAREWYLNRDTKFADRMIARGLKQFNVDISKVEISDEMKKAIDAFKSKQMGS